MLKKAIHESRLLIFVKKHKMSFSKHATNGNKNINAPTYDVHASRVSSKVEAHNVVW